MTWKQIDQLAVGGEQPLDAFVLRGIDGIVTQSHTVRTRRWGFAWGADERPIIGAHRQLAWMLGIHPLTPGCLELSCTLQLAVFDADVHIALGIRSAAGWSTTDETTINTGAAAFETLTIDTTGHQGDAVLFLLLRSSTGANMGSTGAISGARFGYLHVDLSGALGGLTFVDSERYVMTTTDPPSTSIELGGDARPTPRTVIHNPTGIGDLGDAVWAWPPVERNRAFEYNGDYSISFDKLGRAELYGYDVVETELEALPSLAEAVTAGNKPAAPVAGELYARGYELAANRTRVFSGGPRVERAPTSGMGEDMYGDCFSHWGTNIRGENNYSSMFGLPERYLANCTIGNAPDDQRVTGPSGSTTTTNRTKYRAVAALCFPWRSGQDSFEFSAKVSLATFNAVTLDWTDSIVESEVTDTAVAAFGGTLPEIQHWQAPLLGFAVNEGCTFHTLRGAWIPQVLEEPEFAGIRLVEFEIEDTAPATKRQARLLVKTESSRSGNGSTIVYATYPENTANVRFYCSAFLLHALEGF